MGQLPTPDHVCTTIVYADLRGICLSAVLQLAALGGKHKNFATGRQLWVSDEN